MKLLWVSLVEFPPLSLALGKEPAAHCGWLYSSAKSLLEISCSTKLGVIVYSYDKEYKKIDVDGITYYLVPCDDMTKCNRSQIDFCVKSIVDFGPDLIHIHGTEHSLAEAVCRASRGRIPAIANIQGLAIPYTRYADGGLSLIDKIKNITPLDFYRDTFLFRLKHNFRKRSNCERYVLRNVDHIIGRTSWDRDHVLTINPQLQYYFMNESLRDSFYKNPTWSYNQCDKHTIFVSNSGSALKGAHQVIKSLPYIIKKFPDVKVRFCGSNIMGNDVRTYLHMQGYNLYLRRLVKKLKLEENVEFLGSLSEIQMKNEFLRANVYVMPSAIENSPNSVCEAQILGVPTIAAYVGGVPDLVENGVSGFLYRYEEIEQLTSLILKLFSESDFYTLSTNEMSVASARHDREKNASRLIDIYQRIYND